MSVRHMFTPDSLDLEDAARLHMEAILRQPMDARKRWLLQKFNSDVMARIKQMAEVERERRKERLGKPQTAGRAKQ